MSTTGDDVSIGDWALGDAAIAVAVAWPPPPPAIGIGAEATGDAYGI